MTIKEATAKIKKACIGFSKDTPTRTVRFALGISAHYAHTLGYTQEEVLNALETQRSYSAPNYYQAAKFPRLSKNVQIFNTIEELQLRFKYANFRCPSCNGLSTDPYECNSGLAAKTKSGKCDWKVYGLFGCLGRGKSFIIKDVFLKKPIIDTIFQPVSPDGTDLC
jgi:hypothetical protein